MRPLPGLDLDLNLTEYFVGDMERKVRAYHEWSDKLLRSVDPRDLPSCVLFVIDDKECLTLRGEVLGTWSWL